MSRRVVQAALLALLVGGAATIGALLGGRDRPELQRQLDQLGRRLERLENQERAARQRPLLASAQLGADAARAAIAEGAGRAPTEEPATPAEREAEDQRASLEARASELRYYALLDRQAQSGARDPSTRNQIRAAVDSLRFPPGDPAAGVMLEALDCNDSFCRVELSLKAGAAAHDLANLSKQLGRHAGELSMRPPEGGRAVYYLAPPGRHLPSDPQ